MSLRVLFTGGRSLATLILMRLFARAGYYCQVAESLQPNPAGASRYCRGNHKLPAPQTPAFLPALEQVLHAQQIQLLIPTGEEIFYVSRGLRRLEQTGCHVFCPSSDLLTHLYSRYQLNQLLRALKLLVPACKRVTDSKRLAGLREEWQNAVLIPEFGPYDVTLPISDAQTLLKINPSEQTPWVLQEPVKGESFSCLSLAYKGQLRAHCAYVNLAKGQNLLDHPGSERIAAELIKSLDLSGLLSLDFVSTPAGLYTLACRPFLSDGVSLFSPEDRLPEGFFDAGPLLKPQHLQVVTNRESLLRFEDLSPLGAWLRRPRRDDSAWRGHWPEGL